MIAELISDRASYKTFCSLAQKVYQGNSCYRATEASIEAMLVHQQVSYHQHATVKSFVVRDGQDVVARFSLIHDAHLKEYVQVAFFEALPGQGDLFRLIRQTAQQFFPHLRKMVVGLNGHLNYGAGFLLNRFDEPPVFGLPYTPDYYPAYFRVLTPRTMVSFRFPMEVYAAWANQYAPARRSMAGLQLRFMDKNQIRRESAIYTMLNNRSFLEHPYWAQREEQDDLDLFYPFRFFLQKENLIIAEHQGEPVGFYLWYPDFNQMIGPGRDFQLLDLLRFKIRPGIDTFRFTEIGVLPEFRGTPVIYALLAKSLPVLLKAGYQYCEGGFIFEDNRPSIAFVEGILRRCYGYKPEPYRRYAVFETEI